MADQADLASDLEHAERQWALKSRRRRLRVCTVCGEEIEAWRWDRLQGTDVCSSCAAAAADGG